MVITSKNNPLIKETASLQDKKGRKQLGHFLVEGHKMAVECLHSQLSIEKVFMTPTYAEAHKGTFPEHLCVLVSEDVLRHLCDEKTPQGIVCRVKMPLEEVPVPQGKCLILDGVSDPGNMGAIIRTANAAGYSTLYLTQDCTDAFSPKSVRASMSGIFKTKIAVVDREDLPTIFASFNVFVADMVGENVFGVDAPKAFALVIGNEGRGVSDTVRQMATRFISIPMQGGQESLNASVAAGIAMYALAREDFKIQS